MTQINETYGSHSTLLASAMIHPLLYNSITNKEHCDEPLNKIKLTTNQHPCNNGVVEKEVEDKAKYLICTL